MTFIIFLDLYYLNHEPQAFLQTITSEPASNLPRPLQKLVLVSLVVSKHLLKFFNMITMDRGYLNGVTDPKSEMLFERFIKIIAVMTILDIRTKQESLDQHLASLLCTKLHRNRFSHLRETDIR